MLEDLVTLIICTRNRGEILAETLPKWLAQTQPRKIRLIVLDNKSEDNTKDVVSSLQAENDLLEYEICERIGIGANRAKALEICSTEYMAFGDDDAYPEDDWADVLESLLKSTRPVLVGGVYLPWYKYGRPTWYRDRFASNSQSFKYPGLHVAPQGTYASAGNLLVRVKEAREVGGFNPDLGHKGDEIAYGEETMLQRKLLNAGYPIHLYREWKVHHIVFPIKLNYRWFFKRRWKESLVSVLIDRGKGEQQMWKHFFKIILPIGQVRHALKILRADQKGASYTLFILLVLWETTYSLGYVVHFLNYRNEPIDVRE